MSNITLKILTRWSGRCFLKLGQEMQNLPTASVLAGANWKQTNKQKTTHKSLKKTCSWMFHVISSGGELNLAVCYGQSGECNNNKLW